MGRRKSGLDDFVELASLLPWWLSLAIAAVAWFALGAYADSAVPPTGTDVSAALASSIPRLMASVVRYVLPVAFVLGALISAGRSIRNGHLLRRVARHAGTMAASPRAPKLESDPLLAMSWRDFEHLVGEVFRRRGYSVKEAAAGADGGVDLVLERAGDRYFVQCKHWRDRKIGVTVVRELYGIMASKGAAGGAVVTVGQFTAEACAFARKTGIELVEGEALRQQAWLADCVAELPLSQASQAALVARASYCPRCGSHMVQRVAARGTHSGRPFWGCSRFPDCRGIRPI
jgi:restriction system protein